MKAIDQMTTGYFNFDPQDPIYLDHFPGMPVVPGSLIIHAFMLALGRPVGGSADQQMTRFRFKRFISPGPYAYRTEPKSNGYTACYLFDGDTTVAEGIL